MMLFHKSFTLDLYYMIIDENLKITELIRDKSSRDLELR